MEHWEKQAKEAKERKELKKKFPFFGLPFEYWDEKTNTWIHQDSCEPPTR